MKNANLAKKNNNELNKELTMVSNIFGIINILLFICYIVTNGKFSIIGVHLSLKSIHMFSIYIFNTWIKFAIIALIKYKHGDSSWKPLVKYFLTGLIIAFSLVWFLYVALITLL